MNIFRKENRFNFHERVGSYPHDWKLTEIKYLGNLFSGGTPSTTEISYWGGENIWLTPSDLTALAESENYIFIGETNITDQGVKSCSTVKIPTGAVCLSSRATIGDCAITGVDLYTNQGFINIVCNGKCHPFYLLYWIKQFKNYISRYSAGTTFLEISRRTFGKLKTSLPEYDEQKAIVSILSKVDEVIKATENSIKAAEKVKRGLMQNLLTGKLKPDGTWRKEDEFYKDEKFGNIPVGWVGRKWGELIKLEYGKSLTNKEGNHPVFGTNGQIGFTSLPLVSGEGIIVGRKGEYREIHYSNCDFWVIDTAFYVLPKVDFHTKWAYYALKKHNINALDSGSAIPSTNKKDVYHLKACFPKNLNEQRQIAERIDSIDIVINCKQDKKNKLLKLKKSLMQNLLTGKIRVDVNKIEKVLEEI